MDHGIPASEAEADGAESELDGMLSQLFELLGEISSLLVRPSEDDDDPEGATLTGTSAMLHVYDDEDSPVPTHSLTVAPGISDAGNLVIDAVMTFLPSSLEEPVEHEH